MGSESTGSDEDNVVDIEAFRKRRPRTKETISSPKWINDRRLQHPAFQAVRDIVAFTLDSLMVDPVTLKCGVHCEVDYTLREQDLQKVRLNRDQFEEKVRQALILIMDQVPRDIHYSDEDPATGRAEPPQEVFALVIHMY